uniref:Uncharacterized protein n=1 Tax=Apteryx owenii TaxID=8824 RepID=A0A8B9PFU7_APTOW
PCRRPKHRCSGCSAEHPGCSAELPGCSAELPGCSAEHPGCSAEHPGCSAELPGCSAEHPGCSAEHPGCSAELPGCSAELPGCSAELPGCSAELLALLGLPEGTQASLVPPGSWPFSCTFLQSWRSGEGPAAMEESKCHSCLQGWRIRGVGLTSIP